MSHEFIFQIWRRYHEKWDSCNHFSEIFHCIHHDSRQQSAITRWLSAIQMVIIQIQSHSPQHTQTYMKNVEKIKKGLFGKKKRSLSYAPIRWQVRHSVRHAPSWGSARIQTNNPQRIFNFFFLDDLILSVRL